MATFAWPGRAYDPAPMLPLPVFLLPSLAAIVFVFASLAMKRALDEGCSLRWSTLATTVGLAVGCCPLLAIDPTVHAWSYWWAPVVCGVMACLGLFLLSVSLRYGDVSVQTPLGGSKVVFVAAWSLLLGIEELSWPLLAAAGLTAGAVLLLGWSQLRTARFGLQAVIACLACYLVLGAVDPLVQHWAPLFGPMPFLFVLHLVLAGSSLLLLGGRPWRLQGLPPAARRWWLLAALLMGLQGAMYGFSIASFGHATVVNIIYAARGLWSVLLVWWLGRFFGNQERQQGMQSFVPRLAGAALLIIGIALSLLG